MKKNLSFFIFLLIITLSCEKEGGFFTHESSSPDLDSKTMVTSTLPHQSILQSDWWNDMSSTSQTLYSLELSSSYQQITYDDLMLLKEEKIKKLRLEPQNSFRKSKCVNPGFPVPNPEGDVVLSSQADVDAFGATGCDEIVGILRIDDTDNPDPVCDLSPLSNVKKVGSSMTVISSCLTDLDGLDKIKSVGLLGPFGFVGIIGENLTDINALSSLKTITGSINIISCNNLTSTGSAFKKITSIESGKTSAPLTSVYVLNINNNASLTDISGFSNITMLENDLRILRNVALQDLDDLSSINSIGRNIYIDSNVVLQNVDILAGISTISNNLWVQDNLALTSCCGLYDLLCNDPPACTTSGVGGATIIFNNGAGCTDVDIIAGGPCL